MEYACKSIPISHLPVNSKGISSSLCDRCSSRDCDNPVERISVSILGVSEEHKAYMRGNEPYYVVSCTGFVL